MIRDRKDATWKRNKISIYIFELINLNKSIHIEIQEKKATKCNTRKEWKQREQKVETWNRVFKK